jgi:hypothetical protein
MYVTYTQIIRPYLFTLLVLTFIIETLSGAVWLRYAEGILAIAAYAISFHAARRMFQIVGGLFVAAGIGCLLWAKLPVTDLPLFMTKNVMLISLLYMLPFVNHAIRVGGYDRNLSRWLNVRSGHLGQLYIRSIVVSYLLSLFLFFAALPLMHRVLSKYVSKGDPEVGKKFMAMSVLPGFAIVAVWSPVEPLVATAVILTGVSYLHLFPWMLGLSFILLIAGALWSFSFRGVPIESVEDTVPKVPSWGKTGAFLAALVLLISSAFLVQGLLDLSFFAAMTLILLPFSALWAVVSKRLRRFAALSYKQWHESTDGLRHLLVLFLSFGFFNSVVAKTSLFDFMEGPVQLATHYPFVLYLFIFAIFIILPVVGIHPLVIMSLLGIFLQPALEVISPLSLAVVMIICSLSSAFMGTFNSTVTIMSSLLQVNPYRVTVWNLSFGLVFGAIGVLAGLLLL